MTITIVIIAIIVVIKAEIFQIFSIIFSESKFWYDSYLSDEDDVTFMTFACQPTYFYNPPPDVGKQIFLQ